MLLSPANEWALETCTFLSQLFEICLNLLATGCTYRRSLKAMRQGVSFVGCEWTLRVKPELFGQVAKFVALRTRV